MKEIDKILLVLLIMFIGVDRINILPDNFLSFKFTPYLLLSLITIFYTLSFRLDKINLDWLFENKYLLLSLCSFLLFLSLSVLTSIDLYFSFKRFILLLIILVSTILIFSTYEKDTISEGIYIGSIFGSITFYLFNFLLYQYWLGNITYISSFINLEPDTLAYFIPRLGGFSEDVNRGGFILVFFTFIILTSNKKNYFNHLLLFINIFTILLTLSRSSILFLFISIMIYLIFYVSSKSRLTYIVCVLSSIFLFLSTVIYYSNLNVTHIDEVIEERFSLENKNHDSSASIHLKLINDAMVEIKSSLKTFLLGSGHGTSYKLIKGYRMSMNKNANYHSQYLSIFVENGFFAFSSFLFLTFLYPFYNMKNYYFPLILGVMIFNVFYQLINEPTFWLLLFLYYYTFYKKKYELSK
ncbi:MAG: hypothetical protein CMD65_03345 [Gammaproteobacteria bacterium]|nr:hypothetical protein [Gammaproteobacteria bacterium]